MKPRPVAEIFKRRPGQWSARGYLLYLLALPLVPAIVVSLYKGDLRRLIVELAGLALLTAGAWLARRGLRREAEFEASRIARAPAAPLKTLGGLAVAGGVALLSHLAVGNSLAFACVLGALTFGGYWLAYGLDPRTDKAVAPGTHGYSTEEIVQVLAEARARIAAIETAARALRNPELESRLRRIVRAAHDVLAVLEDDPRDVRRARKFLNVYLDGARRVTEGYARAHPEVQTGQLESNFRNVLVTIEDVFVEQRQKLLENDALDLDVQIEVLSTQLEREGVV